MSKGGRFPKNRTRLVTLPRVKEARLSNSYSQVDTDSGSATAGSAEETLTITGAGGITTSASGDTVTVSGIDDHTDLSNIGDLTHANIDTLLDIHQGAVVETIDPTVDASGSTIEFTIQGDGGTDLTVVTPSGLVTVDTTPAASVTLTAGTSTTPQLNYVYFDNNNTLAVATDDWPSTFHTPVATILVLDRATTNTDGALKVHAYTDHLTGADGGHLTHIGKRIRFEQAPWQSGTAITATPAESGSGSSVSAAVATGKVFQMHPHTFPAIDGSTAGHIIVNHPTPYTSVTDLATVNVDANNVSLTNKHYSLVVWGVVSEKTGDCHVMVNLPIGSYNTQAAAERDADKFDVFTIPTNFIGVGFLIARLTIKNTSDTTYTMNQVEDLRGQFPSQSAGGGAGVTDHGDLAGLTDDDHTQYLLIDGTRAMTGAIDMGGFAVTNVGDVDGVDVSAHAADSTIHFIESSIDHGTVSGLDDDDHTQYFLADGTRVATQVNIGGSDTMTINGTSAPSDLAVHSDTRAVIEKHSHSDTAGNGAVEYTARSRGSEASPTVVQDGDTLGTFAGVGYDGTDYALSARIDFQVDGSPGNDDMPGRIVFQVSPDGSHNPAEAMRISQDKTVLLAGTLDMGTNAITNVGNVDGVDVSAHAADSTIHFVEGSIDHGSIAGLGDDDHSLYLLASDATNRATFAANWTDLTDAGATTLHKHDHGGMDGLSDDDHTQYLLADGTRALTGAMDLGGFAITNVGNVDGVDISAHVDDSSIHFVESGIDHGTVSGLDDDDHSVYALLAGRSGGQSLTGGTDASDDLTLLSTSNATKGNIIFGTDSVYDHVNDRFGIGQTSPDEVLHVQAAADPQIKITSEDALEAGGGTENIGSVAWEGQKNSLFRTVVLIKARQDGTWSTATSNIAPSAIEFFTQDASASDTTGTARLTINSAGNVGVGSATSPTANASKVLFFGDNTADPTMGSNTAGIYGKDVSGTVEMFAVDEAGNATQLSPHDPKTGEWIYYSKNVLTGVVKKVRMEKLIKLVEELSGEQLLEQWEED